MAYTLVTLSWIQHLFRDLHLPVAPPHLWCDNISALDVASNPVYQACIRHIEVDYPYIKEKVVHKEIEFGYVATADQLADLLTKGLSPSRFSFILSKLLIRQCPLSLRGSDKPSQQSKSQIMPTQQVDSSAFETQTPTTSNCSSPLNISPSLSQPQRL